MNGVRHAYISDLQNIQIPPELESSFDAVFSNAVLHWCKQNPRGVLDGAKRLLKVGGRFVCEMGGFMNCIGKSTLLSGYIFNDDKCRRSDRPSPGRQKARLRAR